MPKFKGSDTAHGLSESGGSVAVVEPQLSLIEKLRFNDGYKYDSVLRPGSCFFAAIEAAVRDTQQRGLPPLKMRMPPTIVLGLGGMAGQADPLWLWSDVSTGGGLRSMRRVIASVPEALDFLVGAVNANLYLSWEAEQKRKEELAAQEAKRREIEANTNGLTAGPSATPSAVDASEDDPSAAAEADGAAGKGCSEAAAAGATRSRAATARAARDAQLDAASCVMKVGAIANGGLQSVKILSTSSLANTLNSFQAAPPQFDSTPGAIPNAAVTTVLQRFVQPPVSRAAVSRLQLRDGKPSRAYTIESPLLIPRPCPSGKGLEEPGVAEALTASSGTPHTTAGPASAKGDDWRDITESVHQLRTALVRATSWHCEELVLEVIRLPRQETWFATQVKAFRAEKLAAAATAGSTLTPSTTPSGSKRRGPAPGTRWKPLEICCVGDYCGQLRQDEGPEGVVAARRVPYRWMVFDRLGDSVHRRQEKDLALEALELGDSSQLEALAQLVHEDQPGAKYNRKHPARSTATSDARAATLRRLYTPGSIRAGRPLVCFSAPRLYDEVPVCHACYQVYLNKGEGWKKKPTALISVCSAPALGLIGQSMDDLPSECISADTPPPHAPEKQVPEKVGTGGGGTAGGPTSPAKKTAAAPKTPTSKAPASAATLQTPAPKPRGSAPPTAGPNSVASAGAASLDSIASVAKRSHALEGLLKQSQGVLSHGVESPFAMAQRYAFMSHCLCCNVLCKACVVGPEEAEARRKQEKLELQAKSGGTKDSRVNVFALPGGKPKSEPQDAETKAYMARHRNLAGSLNKMLDEAGGATAPAVPEAAVPPPPGAPAAA